MAALPSALSPPDIPCPPTLTNGIPKPAADDADGRQGYTSRFDIPYGSFALQTLDLHIRSSPLANYAAGHWIVFLHGGAFRDPLITSRSIEPSLLALFSSPSPSTVAAVASINYRLSPYPSHPTHPSHDDDESRNVKWPTHIEDVRLALRWLWEEGGMKGRKWVIVGHSVGGTMGMMLGMEGQNQRVEEEEEEIAEEKRKEGSEEKEGEEREILERLKAIICICGIYDFPLLLRNAPPEQKAEYEAFISGAFGRHSAPALAHAYPTSEAASNAPSFLHSERMLKGNVRMVVVAHSKDDELVEWEQGTRMVETLRMHQHQRRQPNDREGRLREEREGEMKVKVKELEIQGGHEDILETGRLGDVVRDALERLRCLYDG